MNISYSSLSTLSDASDFPYGTFGGHSCNASSLLCLRLWGIAFPILAISGILSNTLNVAVFTKLAERKWSPVYYILIALSTADLSIAACFLLNSATLYMLPDAGLHYADIEYRLGGTASLVLRALEPTTNAYVLVSNWSIVALVTFWMAAIYFPLRASQCTRRTVTFVVASYVVAAALVTTPQLSVVASGMQRSFSISASYRAYQVIYALVYEVLPWTMCAIFVSLIAIGLRRQSAESLSAFQQRERKHYRRKQLSLVLTVAALYFVVTTIPSAAAVIRSLWYDAALDLSAPFSRFFPISQLTTLGTLTGRFVCYVLLNRSYRQQLKLLLCLAVSPNSGLGTRDKFLRNL